VRIHLFSCSKKNSSKKKKKVKQEKGTKIELVEVWPAYIRPTLTTFLQDESATAILRVGALSVFRLGELLPAVRGCQTPSHLIPYRLPTA
jgi:hypothetical protein